MTWLRFLIGTPIFVFKIGKKLDYFFIKTGFQIGAHELHPVAKAN